MHRFRRIAGSAVLAAALITGGMAAATPVEVAAASTTEKLIYGAAALLLVSQYYSKLDDQGQAQFYEQCRRQTGVDENPADNNRVQRIYQSLRDTGSVKRNYKVYVSPDKDFNAFMSLGGAMCVNKGALDVLDDDELAYVMAHELTHGEKRHSVAGVKKQVGLVTAVDIYLSDNPSLGALLLGDIAANYVSNAVFTKDQEKQADDIGFDYLVDAGYNPGAAAASMQVLYNKYGNSAPSGIKAVIAPGNHPATSDRINKNVKRMYEYSNRHVNVKDGWIIVNGDKTFQPAARGRYTKEERTYLSAGKLARLFHEHKAGDMVLSGSKISCGDTTVYTVSGTEDGNSIVDSLNKAIAKNPGTDDKDVWKDSLKKADTSSQNKTAKATVTSRKQQKAD